MRSPRFFQHVLTVSFVLGCLALLPLALGATSTNVPAKGKGKAAAATNSANVMLPIPTSVFDVTATPLKNPFFPLSTRHPISQQSATNAPPGISASSFQLVGLSGSADSRLAMINHRTFGVGEAMEVTTVTGAKTTIRVLQIKETSAVIRIITPAQPDLIELSLRKSAQ